MKLDLTHKDYERNGDDVFIEHCCIGHSFVDINDFVCNYKIFYKIFRIPFLSKYQMAIL